MKRFLFIGIGLSLVFSASAKEGMWIPYLLGQLNEAEMQEMGLQISAEDIYSVNNSSLKDAIVHFNGGCTASLISEKGLLLTNHHCGYSQIQSHSSLENNYLMEGYWASNRKEELTNPGVTASIVKYMEDVTNQVLDGVTQKMTTTQRDSVVSSNVKSLLEEWPNEEDYELDVKPFFYGNQFILTAKEKFRDVRLVGAPPSSIGKFGADTDNWMWPRHTGDFSLFRIYASADNRPADVSEDNVPYEPRQHLSINIGGINQGDFTFVFGFPGTTKQYLPAAEVNNIANVYNPLRISVRERILEVLDAKMRKDEATRIKYASKYARTSNSYKRWKGEIKGLEATDAISKKRNLERRFAGKLLRDSSLAPYENVIEKMVVHYNQRIDAQSQRYYFLEAGYFGSELNRHLLGYRDLVEAAENDDEEQLKKEGQRLADRLTNFYKDFDAGLEEEIAQAVLPLYLDNIEEEPLPEIIASLKANDADERRKFVAEMFAENPVLDTADWREMLREKPAKAARKLTKSTSYKLSMAMFDHYRDVLNPAVRSVNEELDKLQRQYVKGLQEAFPDRAFYPDANSSLRVSYGEVKPYEPRDAVTYLSQTYLDGVVAKYLPGDYEFDLPQKLLDLHEARDYGPYAEDGKMPVCFVATNHTTGGNSGSPVLNARGELIGLNFDRAWEGVMSDMHFDTRRCRNVMVDLRYVLFIVDKFAGAQYLIDEIDMVEEEVGKE